MSLFTKNFLVILVLLISLTISNTIGTMIKPSHTMQFRMAKNSDGKFWFFYLTVFVNFCRGEWDKTKPFFFLYNYFFVTSTLNVRFSVPNPWNCDVIGRAKIVDYTIRKKSMTFQAACVKLLTWTSGKGGKQAYWCPTFFRSMYITFLFEYCLILPHLSLFFM